MSDTEREIADPEDTLVYSPTADDFDFPPIFSPRKSPNLPEPKEKEQEQTLILELPPGKMADVGSDEYIKKASKHIPKCTSDR